MPPSSVIEPYGADTMRLAILFIAPPEKDFNWDEEAVAGANRFIKRAWRVVWLLSQNASDGSVDVSKLDASGKELWRTLNAMGIKCTTDFDRGQFNTAISAVMEITNAASKYVNEVALDKRNPQLCFAVAHAIVTMLAPICPHWAEELWHKALDQEGSVYNAAWPEFDAEAAKADEVEIAVQIKGKVRARITVSASASDEEVGALAREAVSEQLAGKEIKKVIVIKGRLVNIVAV